MLKLLAHKLQSFKLVLEAKQSRFSWNTYVKVSKLLHGFIMKVVTIVVAGKKTVSYNGAALAYAKFVSRMYKQPGGKVHLIHYLKKCHILLEQSLCGNKGKPAILPLSPRVGTTGSGIPRIIPSTHRKLIKNHDSLTIQFWLTLFSLYRVLEAPPNWRLNTITCLGANDENSLKGFGFSTFYPHFVKILGDLSPKVQSLLEKGPKWEWNPSIILSAGPNSARNENSILCAGKDALAWRDNGLYLTFRSFCKEVGLQEPLDLIEQASYMVTHLEVSQHKIDMRLKDPLNRDGTKRKMDYSKPEEIIFKKVIVGVPFLEESKTGLSSRIPSLGRLGFKREAGGKVRVFAIIDYWTQSLLLPLHDWLFSILREIPQDGTFDHEAAVYRFRDRIGPGRKVYSYDLSAATDRLPLILQVEILGQIIGKRLATLWGLLLVGRKYYLKRSSKDGIPPIREHVRARHGYRHVRGPEPRFLGHSWIKEFCSEELAYLRKVEGKLQSSERALVYGAGQPMGARSSWPTLAITHHLIVQLAAYRCSKQLKWFTEYGIIGDDVVIAGEEVATEYQAIIRNLGVTIKDAVSLSSTNSTWEFAKSFVHNNVICSPFSFGEMGLAPCSLAGLLGLFLKRRRVPAYGIGQLVRIFGIGYRVRSVLGTHYLKLLKKHFRVVPLLLFLTFPDTSPSSLPSFSAWIRSTGLNITALGQIGEIPLQLWNELCEKEKSDLDQTQIVSFTHDWFPKQGRKVAEVIDKLFLGGLGTIRAKLEDAKERFNDLYDVVSWQGQAHPDRVVDHLYNTYLEINEILDSYPKWVTWDSRPEEPRMVSKISKWISMKLRMLSLLQTKGRVTLQRRRTRKQSLVSSQPPR